MKLWSIDDTSTVIIDPQGEDWSYEDLAHAARDLVLAHGDQRRLAFVWCDEGIDATIAVISAMVAGHVVFIGDASSPRGALEEVFEPELVFAPESGWQVFADEARNELHPDLGLLLSTSGSTGRPRLVRLSYSAIEANAASIATYLELDKDEVAPLNLPLSYAYGLSILTSHLYAGATLVRCETSVMSREFWDAFEDSKCTSLAGVPYTWQMLLRLSLDRLPLDSVRTFTQAGGHLSPASRRKILEWCGDRVRFFVMYGQTEATARISYVPPAALGDHIDCVGIAVPGGELSLEPRDGRHEVIYEGPNVMMGYARERADLGREDELGGRLETGDFGHFDDDGFLVLEGRRGDFVKIFGERVELGWIEDSLRSVLDSVVCVVGEEDRLVIAVEGGDEESIRATAGELGLHPRALEILVLESLPTLSSGKVDRRKLLELAGRE